MIESDPDDRRSFTIRVNPILASQAAKVRIKITINRLNWDVVPSSKIKNVTDTRKIISRERRDIRSWWEWIRRDNRALMNIRRNNEEIAIVIRNNSIGDLQNHCLNFGFNNFVQITC